MDLNEQKSAGAGTDEPAPHTSVCYLCSSIIAGHATRDHAVPKGLIQRSQPKAKGYEYGGVLPTHAACNNRFGPETFAAKALEFLGAYFDPNFSLAIKHPNDPSIQIMMLNPHILAGFEEAELRHFGIIDGREAHEQTLPSPQFFKGKKPINPLRKVLQTAMTVLAKSAAALLYKRHRIALPATWRIVAFPYGSPDAHAVAVSFNEIFGAAKPFDDGLQCWIEALGGGNFFVTYRAQGAVMWFLFCLHDGRVVPAVRSRFPEADHYYFEGPTINSMLSTGWRKLSPLARGDGDKQGR